jgi:uncharacterized protein YbjT (DUF2867 family)
MKIAIIGGTGFIGRQVVENLRGSGHQVLAASSSSGVNVMTGEGLDNALANVDVVVDVTNPPSYDERAVLNFFQTAGHNLLTAELKAGVTHHLMLSIVGTDRMLESGYYRGKMVQENLVTASPIPWTVVRATQFFEFVSGIADASAQGQTVRLPTAQLQPIEGVEVARFVARAAETAPIHRIVEIAGPEKIGLDDLVRRFFGATGDSREVISDPNATYFGAKIDDGSLIPGKDAHLGTTRFDDWLKTTGAINSPHQTKSKQQKN